MQQLATLIVAAKNSVGKANEKAAFAELYAFLDDLPVVMEVVDFE